MVTVALESFVIASNKVCFVQLLQAKRPQAIELIQSLASVSGGVNTM